MEKLLTLQQQCPSYGNKCSEIDCQLQRIPVMTQQFSISEIDITSRRSES